jgi:HD-GYP domain-containing protein (c-di-GMP phosphodiesterase class II)
MSERAAQAVYCLDERWNGFAFPHGRKKTAIPLLARIACLAQTVAAFHAHFGKEKALAVARSRSKTWFEPQLVKALLSLEGDDRLWSDLRTRPREALHERTLEALNRCVLETDLDSICVAFASIVDAKSPFTANHSQRVAGYAVEIGARLGFTPEERRELHHAGLLHDLGKLGVSNLILEKPGKLTDEERDVVRRHPEWTAKIRSDLPPLGRVREIAAAHHEKLDGTGYWRGLSAERLDLSQRVLAVADIWDALTADRPYRPGMSHDDALKVLRKDAEVALDTDCIDALQKVPPRLQQAA